MPRQLPYMMYVTLPFLQNTSCYLKEKRGEKILIAVNHTGLA